MRSSPRPAPGRRVILFDVDGTLVHAAGAGRRSLERVLAGEFGRVEHALVRAPARRDDRPAHRPGGRWSRWGAPSRTRSATGILEGYVVALREEIQGPGFRVLPGVAEVLGGARRRPARRWGSAPATSPRGRASSWPGAPSTASSSGARTPSPASPTTARPASCSSGRPSTAARAGSARRSHPADALVVGDTPRDVSAARAHGVPVVGVATGRYGAEELRAAGADGVLATLDGAAPRCSPGSRAARRPGRWRDPLPHPPPRGPPGLRGRPARRSRTLLEAAPAYHELVDGRPGRPHRRLGPPRRRRGRRRPAPPAPLAGPGPGGAARPPASSTSSSTGPSRAPPTSGCCSCASRSTGGGWGGRRRPGSRWRCAGTGSAPCASRSPARTAARGPSGSGSASRRWSGSRAGDTLHEKLL